MGGYCESANPGNKDREAECMMCFDYVRTEANKMWEELDNTAEQVDTAAMRMMFAQYMFCADTYLAPVYSDCFENIDDLITYIEDNNQEEWGKKLLEDQGCMLSSSPSTTSRTAPTVPGTAWTVSST